MCYPRKVDTTMVLLGLPLTVPEPGRQEPFLLPGLYPQKPAEMCEGPREYK